MLDSLGAESLARLQFAFTVSFHIVFPALSIGLASYLAVLEGAWLLTRRPIFYDVYQYWLKIFAVVFGMGVVSGIVMSYQFGTNWSVFSDKAGPIVGPLMGYEVMTAFFLEAGFLGIMLFGEKRVGRKLHFAATLIVAAGTLMSAFWILSVNSWMHTPVGYAVNEQGQFVPDDWWAIVFNPSFPYRFVHMVLACYLSTAFAVGAVGAWHLLRDRANPAARLMFSMAMWMAVVVAPVQIFAGDLHGLNTLEYQPAKIAAMEGHFETRTGAPLILFGLPDMEAEETRYAVEVPRLGSLILTHEWDGRLRGLKSWPPEDRPYAPLVFWSFRVMVGLGLLMVLAGVWSLWRRMQGRLYEDRRLARFALLMAPSGFLALIAGWITTEVGRQPYTIYGLLRTEESLSPVGGPAVFASLFGFVAVYLLVFGVGVVYLLRLMARTPETGDTEFAPGPLRAAGLLPGLIRRSLTGEDKGEGRADGD